MTGQTQKNDYRNADGYLMTTTCIRFGCETQVPLTHVWPSGPFCAAHQPAPVTTTQSDNLGSQLWEECEKCGAEPSYAGAHGHLCAACSGAAHPMIPGPAVPYQGVEPDETEEL
jgi:hypothetical protein